MRLEKVEPRTLNVFSTMKSECGSLSNTIEQPPYSKLKEHGFNSWVVMVVKKEGNWFVRVKTEDKIYPSFSCLLKFDENGNIESCPMRLQQITKDV